VSRNEALMACYEELRHLAVGRHAGRMGWGLVVLKTKGMAAWARTWQEHGPGPAPQMVSNKPAPTLFPSSGEELVQVLAGMIWSFQREDR
jgi:hypothetical protein